MLRKNLYLLLCVLLILIPVPVASQDQDKPVHDDVLAERRLIAESGEFLHEWIASQTEEIVAAATGSALAEAMDIQSTLLTDATISGSSSANGVFAGLGVIKAKHGSTFALLSSGIAGTSSPEPGVDFSPGGVEGDRVTLRLTLNVPQGATRLSFDYNFLSAEFPDFIGTSFNDTFQAILTDSSGVREIARASVNSSVFVPAAASTAGGSGFDIFTADPSGVDNSFGSGLPDAGLTGFNSANVSIVGGQTVTLEFLVEDRGDGILDSAVILDNLVIGSLEIVDPNPDNPNQSSQEFIVNGLIVNNPEKLAKGGEIRKGAAADGVTKLILRNRVSGPGTVEFCLKDSTAPADGGLSLLGASGRNQCVNSTVANTTQGFMAFAIYQVPDEFNRGSDQSLKERPIKFKAKFTPATGTTTETEAPFKLVRPPVMLIHGLWSSSDAWTTFPMITDGRFAITVANYAPTNARFFQVNRFEPGKFINIAIAASRAEDIAVTQVDIAGHSMGGILSRNHVALGTYKRNENFNQGDINKLITLNTPHTGSPFANLLQGLRATPILGGLVESAFATINHPINQGAIQDLAVGSSAINSIQRTQVPSHAIVGTGGSDALALIPGQIGAVYKIVNFFASTSNLFQGLQHDGIVGRKSQEGGISVSAQTIFGGLGSIHTSVTSNVDYSNRVTQLLNSQATSSSFAEFPAPSSLGLLQAASMPEFSIVTPQSVALAGLTISSPANGTVVAPGSAVNVVIQPDAGTTIQEVLLVGPNVAETDNTAPFEISLTIPTDAVGAFEISALGRDASNNFFTSNTVTLQVVPQAALDSITIIPQNTILFDIGESQAIAVIGSYSDGVLRDITGSATGTQYLTSDASIVTISPEGVVTAVSAGTATIVAQNNGRQNSINVIVLQPNQPPVANAGADQTVSPGTLVTLNGSGSSDPDNGPQPLTFEWFQVGGPAVVLSNPNAANPTFTPTTDSQYTFSLIVRDGQADSPPDNVTINVVSAPACVQFAINLDGRKEVPANPSTARGAGAIRVNTTTNTLSYYITYTGLSSRETSASISGFAAVGSNAGVLHTLPFGPSKSGTWTYAEAQEANILTGLTYINVHSQRYPNGEIRGQITNGRECTANALAAEVPALEEEAAETIFLPLIVR